MREARADLTTTTSLKPATPRLHLRAEGYKPQGPELPPSNMRFDFNLEHEVAAAVLLILDKDDMIDQWMTLGDAGRDDVFLTHDSWAPMDRQFPMESFIYNRPAPRGRGSVGVR